MANITKQKRDQMLAFLENLKKLHTDDESVRAFNEIENHLKDKKFGLVFEEHTEEVDERLKEYIPVFQADKERRICKDKTREWNFIIEGDNLQALYLLEKTHKGRIDCIYIDPPYNTGARDWKYNNDYVDKQDTYRHSKWLSFMNARLRLAKRLLKKDGALIITIDDNELANVYLLISELFPDYKNVIITIQMNPGGTQGKAFSVTNEYAIVVYREKVTTIFRKRHFGDDTYNLRRWGSTSDRAQGATCFYPVIVDKNNDIIGFGDVLDDDVHPSAQFEEQPDGTKLVYPIDITGVEKKWRYGRDTVESIFDRLFVEESEDRLEIKVRRETEPPKTVWVSNDYNAESHGTKLIKEIIGKDRFSYPKSIYAVKDCLDMIVSGKPEAIVLDFFAGSGTTLNALNLINAEDGGHRTCIMVTNNEVSESVAKALIAEGLKPGCADWENHGIARYVTWPRTKNTILGVDENGKDLVGEYVTSVVSEKEKKRKFIQIGYINFSQMSLAQKKQFVSLITKGVLPQTCVEKDTSFVVSHNIKHTASILFDDTKVDEWLEKLAECEHITDFYIVTSKNKLFKDAKSRIEEILGNLIDIVHVTRPLKDGFTCNVKFFKCDWTDRHPEDYYLSNALCLHIKEMIELQNAIEIDGVKNVLLLNRDDVKRSILDPVRYAKAERIWLNENIILNTNELNLLRKKGFRFIPKEFFGQELREVAE